MKIVPIWVAVLLFLSAAAAAQEAREVAPVRWQEVSVVLEPEKHLVVGESTVAFGPGAGKVQMRLSEATQVQSVRMGGEKLPYLFRQGVLSVELPPKGDLFPVAVSYRVSFNDPVSTSPAASEDPGYGVNAAVTAWGTFLGGGAFWYPVPEAMPGTRKVTITAPAGTEGITQGARLSRETTGGVSRSVWSESRPVGILSLSAGPYTVEERQAGEVKIYSYLYPGNAQLSSRYLDATARYLAFYSELFGPYPFEKFAVVENFFPTGYGFPSFTLLGGSVIRLPFIVDTSLPHEIAHSWWGNGVDVDMSQGNWCEGLVTYLADYLLKERRSQKEALEYRKQLLIDYASLVDPGNDFPLTAFTSRSDPASRAIGYGKAAMVFHMIRTRVGDERFFSALKALARERMYGSASWSEVVAAFSKSAGADLGPAVRPWLTRPGAPRLALSRVSSRPEGGGWLVAGTITDAASFAELEVPLRLETVEGAVERTVRSSGGASRFAISTSSAPKRLLLDPEISVFRLLLPGEIPATVNSIKGSRRLTGVYTENCRMKSDRFKAFLESLSQPEARVIPERELDMKSVIENDLVICGTPKDPSLVPPVPDEAADLQRELPQEALQTGDALLFLVLKRPHPGKGVVALLQPLSEAAVQYASKIAHYGKYGHLVFSGGVNRHKGTIAPSSEGTAVAVHPAGQ